jgi:PilZ domain-containing protein
MLYVGKDLVGQGVLREISRGGCHILGNYPVTLGETLGLRILHPTQPDPLVFEQVTVRWVKGFEFGVAFGLLDQAETDRLHDLLDDFLNSGSYSELCVPS